MSDEQKPQVDLGTVGAVANWIFTKFGATDFILIVVIFGMMAFWTGWPIHIPNQTLERVEHIETTTSRLCIKLVCAPEDEACRERCWTGSK